MGAMIDISKALTIDGWMSEAELRWLAEQAQTHTQIVEIGSWKGRSTRALADNCPGFVYAVDHWRGQELTADPTSLDAEIAERGSDSIYEEFKANLDGVFLYPMRMSSIEAAAVMKSRLKPDMVFIDGEHAYAGVKADIETWLPLMAKDGLLCGHDWWHGGIKQAVRELCPGFQVVPETNIWWVRV